MDKYKKITRVLKWIFVANLIVAVVKLGFGFLFNINSLTADGFHALTDTFSNIIGIIGIRFASKPADKDHPYGYQKFETLAGLAIGFMLLGIIIKIISNAISSFINPVELEVSLTTIIALAATIFINIFVATYEYRAGKKLRSDVLISDSIHTKSDIFISSGVLITLILIKLGLPSIIDPILSLVIALFILKSCYEIFQMTIEVLVDKMVVDPKEVIRLLEESSELILDIHKIRSRGRMDHVFIDLHIITKPDLTVREAHELSHYLEKVLEDNLEKKVDLVCHIEPDERNPE